MPPPAACREGGRGRGGGRGLVEGCTSAVLGVYLGRCCSLVKRWIWIWISRCGGVRTQEGSEGVSRVPLAIEKGGWWCEVCVQSFLRGRRSSSLARSRGSPCECCGEHNINRLRSFAWFRPHVFFFFGHPPFGKNLQAGGRGGPSPTPAGGEEAPARRAAGVGL